MSKGFTAIRIRESPSEEHTHQVPIKITLGSDNNFLAANPLYFAAPLENDDIGVYKYGSISKVEEGTPVISHAHAGRGILDLKWSPFDFHLLGSCSRNGVTKMWKIPAGGLKENLKTPLQVYPDKKKVGMIGFHPAAANVFGTTCVDTTIKLWDVEKAVPQITIKFPKSPTTFDYNNAGNEMYVFAQDKKLRKVDPRASSPITAEIPGHKSIKGARVMYCRDQDLILTTGFQGGTREIRGYDPKKFDKELFVHQMTDQSSGVIVSFYDPDLQLLYCVGRGEAGILVYTFKNGVLKELKKVIHKPVHLGAVMVPKLALRTQNHEIGRLLTFVPKATKLGGNPIMPLLVDFSLKTSQFQPQLYPDTDGFTPTANASDFFGGKEMKTIGKVSLDPKKRPKIEGLTLTYKVSKGKAPGPAKKKPVRKVVRKPVRKTGKKPARKPVAKKPAPKKVAPKKAPGKKPAAPKSRPKRPGSGGRKPKKVNGEAKKLAEKKKQLEAEKAKKKKELEKKKKLLEEKKKKQAEDKKRKEAEKKKKKEEAEKKKKEDAEKKAKEETEKKAKEEADKKKEEAAAKAKEEEDLRQKEEEVKQMEEEIREKEEEEKRLQEEEDKLKQEELEELAKLEQEAIEEQEKLEEEGEAETKETPDAEEEEVPAEETPAEEEPAEEEPAEEEGEAEPVAEEPVEEEPEEETPKEEPEVEETEPEEKEETPEEPEEEKVAEPEDETTDDLKEEEVPEDAAEAPEEANEKDEKIRMLNEENEKLITQNELLMRRVAELELRVKELTPQDE